MYSALWCEHLQEMYTLNYRSLFRLKGTSNIHTRGLVLTCVVSSLWAKNSEPCLQYLSLFTVDLLYTTHTTLMHNLSEGRNTNTIISFATQMTSQINIISNCLHSFKVFLIIILELWATRFLVVHSKKSLLTINLKFSLEVI